MKLLSQELVSSEYREALQLALDKDSRNRKIVLGAQGVRSRDFLHVRFPRLHRPSVPPRTSRRFTHSAETVSRTKARAHVVLDTQKYLDALWFPRSRPHSDSLRDQPNDNSRNCSPGNRGETQGQ